MTLLFNRAPLHALLAMLVLLVATPGSAGSATNTPTTLAFRASKKALLVLAPKTTMRVVVEENTDEGWVPLLVEHLSGVARRSNLITIDLPRVIGRAKLRVLGYKVDRFDAEDLDGATEFEEDVGLVDDNAVTDINGTLLLTGNTASTLTTNGAATTTNGVVQPARDTSVVVESDIWKIIGDKLFFFNQYRGLQAFDLSDPAHPVKTGTMRLAASGEQFYSLTPDGSRLALLGRSSTGGRSVPVLYSVSVTAGKPKLSGKLDLGGAYVLDSRLVGDRLYALVKGLDSHTGYPDYTYLPGDLRLVTLSLEGVASILDDQRIPAPFLWYSANSLQIDGGKLLVSTTETATKTSWDITRSKVTVFDITNASGIPALEKVLEPKGFVSDKFKMAVVNGHLAVTSVTNSYGNFATPQSETWVEMFPLSGSATAAIGGVELVSARGERLYATRYDGNRAYVVTFRNTDPLFIVDLTVASAPEVKGELVIPGWSTYLQPHGDRLLSVGVENWKVAVSLFDVSDSAKPTLLSRVYPGTDGYYSWSEANYDEKAVEYDAKSGLLAVPFQSWSNNGYISAMQQITVGRDVLTLGAAIDHGTNAARRGNMINGRFVSISGQQMLVTNATTSSLEAQLTLAWRVDNAVPIGSFLAQIEQGPELYSNYWWGWSSRGISLWGSTAKPVLRVSAKADPDDLVSELSLGTEGVAGFAVRDSKLFIGQFVTINEDTFLRTRVIQVDAQGKSSQTAMTDQKVDPEIAASLDQSKLTALWPNSTTLAWLTPVTQYRGWPWYYWGGVVSMPLQLSTGTVLLTQASTRSTKSQEVTEPAKTRQPLAHICTILKADTASPTAGRNRIIRGGEASAMEIGNAYAAGGFVMLSYQDERTVKSGDDLRTKRGWWLQALDLRDNARITARQRTPIPAKLISINQVDSQGAILLTATNTWDYQQSSYAVSIAAAAYDGVDVFELDRWESTNAQGSYTTFTADGTRAFVCEADPANSSTALLSTVTFDSTANKLSKAGSLPLAGHSGQYTVKAVQGQLFASRYGYLETATIGANGQLGSLKTYEAPSNLWLPVDRATADDRFIYLPALDYGVELIER